MYLKSVLICIFQGEIGIQGVSGLPGGDGDPVCTISLIFSEKITSYMIGGLTQHSRMICLGYRW